MITFANDQITKAAILLSHLTGVWSIKTQQQYNDKHGSYSNKIRTGSAIKVKFGKRFTVKEVTDSEDLISSGSLLHRFGV